MAEEYELGTVGPIPTVNPNVAKIGEMLKLAKKYADQYYVKDYVPLIGGTTLGEFLLGKAPEEIERWGQGDYPFRNPSSVVGTGGNRLDVWKTGRFEPTFDVFANVALPAVGTGQVAARVTKNLPVGGSIMGPESKLWQPEMAFQAGKMESKGAKPEEILEATGMVRGLDNQWRTELSDQFAKMKQKGDMFSEQYMAAKDIDPLQVHLIKAEEAKYGRSPPKLHEMTDKERNDYDIFRKEKIEEHGRMSKAPVTVKDVLDHPELLKAYPELGNIKVQVGSGHGGQRGSYNQGQNTITLASYLDSDQSRSTMLHELTHAIQGKEGFNRGGNPDMFTHQNLALELKQKLEIRDVADVVKKGMPDASEADVLAKLENIYKNKGFDQDYLKEALDRTYWSDEVAQKAVKEYGLDKREIPYSKEEMYKNLAGEAEARMVQNRLDLSPEELRTNFPYQYAPNKYGLDIDPDTANVISDRGQLINEPSYSLEKPFAVSTRVPTAVKAEEDALKQSLFSNYKAFTSDPKAFEHNVELIKQYPNLALKSKNANVNAEKFVEHVKDNLLYLHDKVPADTRARSKLWYEGANKIANNIAKDYDISEPAASGILAVLSPQKDWFMNVSLGERVASTMAFKQGYKWDSAMSDVANDIYGKPQYKPLLDAIKGKRLEELNDPVEKAIWIRTYDQANNPREHFVVTPEGDFSDVRTNAGGEPTKTGWGSNAEIAKAVNIFDNPSRENINNMLGGQHKVRNFYMNIYDPQSKAGHTTIDTHAVAAGLLRPLSGNTREVSHNFGSNYPGEVGPKNSAFTGNQGTYGLYHEGYQRAAKERGILPREMQSITWEAVRGLFPDTFKNAKNAEEIENIWKRHKSGKISIDEARDEILQKAGGINEPEWKQ
jgi:hypothetical protein